MISAERQTKRKPGRPKKPVLRKSTTGVRFTRSEYFIVKEKAIKAGIRLTVYIRQMAINGKIIARMNEEERQFVRQLTGMSNNLNQLAKKAHQEGMLTAALAFEKYRDQIDELLQQLKR